jgi:hypothetical protein
MHTSTWEHIIEVDLKSTELQPVDSIYLTQNRALVNTAMNVRVP